MKAVRIHEVGGPEVLKYEDCPDLKPGPGEAVVNVEAVGVNFTDVGTRRGSAPPASFPWIPGREAAGTVSAIGEGVTEAKVGDAVGYCSVGSSYAEQVLVPSSALIKLPEGIDAKMAAAVLLQGMTAHYLAFSTYSLQPGDSCVVHAGAGGTGLMLIQMAKRAGARVFATVSKEEKAALAKEAGADRAIIYTREEFDDEVMKSHRRPGSPGSLRLGGQDDLRQEPQLPRAARLPGSVRGGQRTCHVLRTGQAGEGLAVPHTPESRRLYFHQERAPSAGRGGAGLGIHGRAEGAHRRDLCSVRGSRGAPATRGPRDHREAASSNVVTSASLEVGIRIGPRPVVEACYGNSAKPGGSDRRRSSSPCSEAPAMRDILPSASLSLSMHCNAPARLAMKAGTMRR